MNEVIQIFELTANKLVIISLFLVFIQSIIVKLFIFGVVFSWFF